MKRSNLVYNKPKLFNSYQSRNSCYSVFKVVYVCLCVCVSVFLCVCVYVCVCVY